MGPSALAAGRGGGEQGSGDRAEVGQLLAVAGAEGGAGDHGDLVDHLGGAGQRRGVADHAGAGGHRPLEAVAGGGDLLLVGRPVPTRRRQCRERRRERTGRTVRRSRRTSPAAGPSTLRMAPVAAGPSCPAATASTARAPKTRPSSSELDARRLAPCTPGAGDLAGGPQARQRRGAVEVGDDAAAQVVGRRGDGEQVAGGVEADLDQPPGDRREPLGEAVDAGGVEQQWSTPCSSMREVIARLTWSRGSISSTKRSPWTSRMRAPSPRRASVSSGRGMAVDGAARWGGTARTRRRRRRTPARRAMAMPSPVASIGLVVTAKSWPAPPVASSVCRARTSTVAPPGPATRDPDAPAALDDQVEREGALVDARRPWRGRRRPAPARPRRRWRRRRRARPGRSGGRPRGPGRAGRRSSRSKMAPRPMRSRTRVGALVRPAPARRRRRRGRRRRPACRRGGGRCSRRPGRARRRRRPGPTGWWPSRARPW